MERNQIIATIAERRDQDAIADGSKTCEARLWAGPWHPARDVREGDWLWFRRRRGPLFAAGVVTQVDAFDDLDPASVERLAAQYTACVDGPVYDAAFWAAKANARKAVFAHFDLRDCTMPSSVDLPFNYFGWVPGVELA